MTDYKTISAYDSQVDNYLNMVDTQSPDATLVNFIARLKTNDYVLDLGCGPAHCSVTMRQRGLRVDPTDASEEMVTLANSTFDIGARQALFTDINSENTYDAIWANFSLLHAKADDFANILQKLHTAIKAGGIFHLCMKIGKGSRRDKLGRYYSYYSQAELCSYLHNAGFIVDNIALGEATGLAGEAEPWIAIISAADHRSVV
ncbi:hypothetical protein A9R01_11330 ['Osedax' symbiont bacterium Rs2_46_30_T18]|nr:hypothetical protein A9R01_11330 ['Osedax' symbiont bacterium Rs2_46_30_T18]